MGRLILFNIGSINVYTHGLFFVLAVLISAIVLYYISRSFSKNNTIALDLVSWSLISGIIVARILYIIIYFDQFHSISDYINLSKGGLVSWGGYAGGLIVAYFIIKQEKENLKKWMDAILISGMLGITIGRIGCILSGELAGKNYTGLFNILGKYPTTLLEAALTLLIFVVIYFFYKARKAYDGFWWKTSLALYAFGRFFIDFTRDEAVYYLKLSQGQVFSIIVFIFLIILIILEMKKRGKYVR